MGNENPSDEQRWIPSQEQLPGGKVTPPSGIPGTDEGQTDWGAPEAPSGPVRTGQPGSYPPPGGQQSSGMAVASLVCGILGFIFCPVVCHILALVFGYSARSEIDNSGGRLGNRGLATAGIVLGWVGIGLTIAVVILVIVIAATTDSSSLNEGGSTSTSLLLPLFS